MFLIINLVNKFLQMILLSTTNGSNEKYFWRTIDKQDFNLNGSTNENTIDFIHREGDERKIEEIDIYRNYYLVKNL